MGITTRDAAASPVYHPGATVTRRTGRIASLDIARGIIMVLMAIDHVRVYSGVPAGGPTFGVFFTRWVTNFSAPGFVLLAGTGAYLYGLKAGGKQAVARYLFVRGLLLIALELTVLRLAWTFNLDFAHYNLAGVLWMLGWCMILMSGLVWLPTAAIGVIGIAVVVGQSAFAAIGRALPHAAGAFLYNGGEATVAGLPILVLYVIVPWVGVMAIGYWFGTVMTRDDATRRTLCMRIGLAATAAFVVAATALAVAQPASGAAPPMLFRILAQRKYPASVLFLLMTLGPIIAFLPAAERMRGPIANVLSTFGRVPLFFYVLHIPLIHATALLVSLIHAGRIDPWLFGNHPLAPPRVPAGYEWSLALLYLVFAVVVALLYVPCRWYASARARDETGLLRYF